jgi:hypothetical protein
MLLYHRKLGMVEEPPNEAFLFGRDVHKALERIWERPREEWLAGITFDYRDVIPDSNPKKLRYLAETMVDNGAELVKKTIDPSRTLYTVTGRLLALRTEERIVSRRHNFSGVIDLSGVDFDGNSVILDYKTTNFEFDLHAVMTNLQPTCYAWLMWLKYGIIPSRVGFVTLDKKTGYASLVEGKRSFRDIQRFEALVKSTHEAIKAGYIYAMYPDACVRQYYSKKFVCPFYRQCWGQDYE